ncbi:hypothetical protein JYK22_37100, partial [Nonomuraea sp. RK-328]|nr:hypothetical protein [Nonomuraea sp. RK-328]
MDRSPGDERLILGGGEVAALKFGREADGVYNDMYRQWALDRPGVDPAEDAEFLRAFRSAVGQDPETGLYPET